MTERLTPSEVRESLERVEGMSHLEVISFLRRIVENYLDVAGENLMMKHDLMKMGAWNPPEEEKV